MTVANHTLDANKSLHPHEIESRLAGLLPRVAKPGRYVGGELNQCVKEWNTTSIRVALAFPDVYEIGMPNLGLAILYDIVNRQPDMLAERVYVPWTDMERELRAASIPLYSLETKHALSEFDVIGFSLPYETLYTNVLTMLDLAHIPLRSDERGLDDPVIIAGGHATLNPEPMAFFIDAFAVGEGEEVMLDIARCVAKWRSERQARTSLWTQLATIEGVYVPQLYQTHYREDGTLLEITPTSETVPRAVRKRIVAKLPPPVTHFIVPNIEVIHNRAAIEIMRGCTRGCRFCQAGMITRPVRERPVEEIVEAIEIALQKTGFEEVALLSLSSSDYDEVLKLVQTVRERFADRHLNISLPSLRIESFSIELMEALQGSSRRSGFTLAPEAASERMREIINKPVSTAQLLETAREIFRRGWHLIKLYFMIGHPRETLDDVQAIADLCKAVLAEGEAEVGKRAQINVGVSTFVPKSHTPFQWAPCDTIESIRLKQALLRRELRGRGFKLSVTDPYDTMLEAWLSRGDRRMGDVILHAWRHGARFDAWREHFKLALWQEAFEATGLDLHFYTHRERALDEILPWDHIDAAVTKKFLVEDYEWSVKGKTRVDCREKCFACGILPKFKELRREHPGDVWECPDVGKAAAKAKAQTHSSPVISPTI